MSARHREGDTFQSKSGVFESLEQEKSHNKKDCELSCTAVTHSSCKTL